MKLPGLFSRTFRQDRKNGWGEWEGLLTPGLISSVENGFRVNSLDTGLGANTASRMLRLKYQVEGLPQLNAQIDANLAEWDMQALKPVRLFEAISGVIEESPTKLTSLDGVWAHADELFEESKEPGEERPEFTQRLGEMLISMQKLFETEYFNVMEDMAGVSARAYYLDLASALLRLGHSAGIISEERLVNDLNDIYYLTVSHYRSWRQFARGYLAVMACYHMPLKPLLEKILPACLYEEDSPWVRSVVFE